MRKYILYLYTDQDKIPHKYLTFAWNDPNIVCDNIVCEEWHCYNIILLSSRRSIYLYFNPPDAFYADIQFVVFGDVKSCGHLLVGAGTELIKVNRRRTIDIHVILYKS